MIVLAMLFGWAILLNGSTVAAIQGRFAQKLDLPGSTLIPWMPWLMLVAYVLMVIPLLKTTARWRWRRFIVVTLLCHFAIGYPLLVLDWGAVGIPLTARLDRERQQFFDARYPVKSVNYSSSREGSVMLVRRADYTPELAAFAQDLALHQTVPGPCPDR